MFNEDGYPTSGFRDMIGSKNFNEVVKLLGNKPKKPHWLIQLFMKISLMAACGTTVMCLWNWFVSPLGVPNLNLFHALGIDTLVTFIITLNAESTAKEMDSWTTWITNVLFAFIILGIGFVLHFFI